MVASHSGTLKLMKGNTWILNPGGRRLKFSRVKSAFSKLSFLRNKSLEKFDFEQAMMGRAAMTCGLFLHPVELLLWPTPAIATHKE